MFEKFPYLDKQVIQSFLNYGLIIFVNEKKPFILNFFLISNCEIFQFYNSTKRARYSEIARLMSEKNCSTNRLWSSFLG